MWLDVIEIAVFVLLLGLLYLPFKIFKISDKTRYTVYLVICIAVVFNIFLDPAFDNKFILLPILLTIIGLGKRL